MTLALEEDVSEISRQKLKSDKKIGSIDFELFEPRLWVIYLTMCSC